MMTETTRGLKAYGDLLRELNKELVARFDELPPDIRALLVQKGAITQRATDELGLMVETCAKHLADYEALLGRCRYWLDSFFIPLDAQCADKNVPNRVDTEDLKALIAELTEILANAGNV